MIALLSSSSNGLTIRAYTLAPASLLAPFIYAEIIGATIYGWIFWREFPDAWTWLGASVIVLAGLYVVHREIAGRAPEMTADAAEKVDRRYRNTK